MYNKEIKEAVQAIREAKEKANDLQVIVDELKALPKEQLEKLLANDRLTAVLKKYGVEL